MKLTWCCIDESCELYGKCMPIEYARFCMKCGKELQRDYEVDVEIYKKIYKNDWGIKDKEKIIKKIQKNHDKSLCRIYMRDGISYMGYITYFEPSIHFFTFLDININKTISLQIEDLSEIKYRKQWDVFCDK